MVFTLVSSAQEWLNVKWDEFKKLQDEAQLKKQKEEEEAERVICFHYFIHFLINNNT